MTGASGAHFLVRGVRRDAAGVADGRRPDARQLPERLLLAPEAAEPDDDGLESLGRIGLDGVAEHEVPVADGVLAGVAAGECVGGVGKLGLGLAEDHGDHLSRQAYGRSVDDARV
jgi:hypothetical protein